MIAQNLRTKEAVLQEAIDHFSRDFRSACQSQGSLRYELRASAKT